MEDIDNLLHGYVHGHIHRHKDHTHIHGHIHSHDKTSDEEQSLIASQLDCPFDELPLCEEIFCSELDDCYYSNCDDSTNTRCCMDNENPYYIPQSIGPEQIPENFIDTTIKTESPNTQMNEYMNSLICNDPTCLQSENTTVCCYDESHTKTHTDNLCKLQKSEKQLFDVIFNEFHRDFSGSAEEDSINNSKQVKLGEIHYPHETHPMGKVHEASFHTSVPEMNMNPGLLDYDFYFKFGNKDDHKVEEVKDAKDFTCKWDNCLKSVQGDNLLVHVFNNHLKEEQVKNNPTLLNCEWENCNYSDTNLDSLIEHLNVHKQTQDVQPTIISPSSPSVNITNLKITPKMGVKNATELTYTEKSICNWDVNGHSCGKYFESAGDLQQHLIDDHIGAGKSSYNCQWLGCDRHDGKPFPQRQKLLRHIHTHTNFKPWTCNICGSNFAVESMLTQHLRIHSGEKPYKCSICEKTFATSSSLSIHNRVHTGEKPLVCKYPGCGKKFSESSNLAKHMRTHSKKLHCDICQVSFDSRTDYLSHLKMHQHVMPEVDLIDV